MQAIELLLNSTAGFVHGQPTLQPGTDYYCPQVNETLTFFCNDSRIYVIEWIVEGYIPQFDIWQVLDFHNHQSSLVVSLLALLMSL